jgi:hypothetical protein
VFSSLSLHPELSKVSWKLSYIFKLPRADLKNVSMVLRTGSARFEEKKMESFQILEKISKTNLEIFGNFFMAMRMAS